MDNTNQVFVVDNDPSARHGLVRLLIAAGHNVKNYASLKDLFGSLESSVSGCLLLDVDVPETSFNKLMDKLKALNADLSIIIISANEGDKTIKGKSWKKKAEGFFRKPVDGVALIDAIEWALRSKTGNANNSYTKND